MVVPLYIGEIAPPEIRGSLLVFEALFVVLGIVIAFWITYGTRHYSSNWSWQIPFMLQIFPGIILGFGAWFLPFSPRWLASKDREDEALASLVKLRRLPATDSRVQREWMEIIAEARFQAGVQAKLHPTLANSKSMVSKIKLELAGWLDCFGAGCWRRTLVGVGLMFFQQFIGINALIYYSPTLFGTMGLDLDMQLIMSGILNILQLAGVFTSVWTIDRFGRKPMLLIGSVVALICLVIITILVATYSDDWASHRVQGWTSVGLLLFYMLGFGASWTSIPWAVPAEVFPSSLRAKGVSISTCSSTFYRPESYDLIQPTNNFNSIDWINNFIIGLITPPLVQNTGYGAYIFFAVFCLLSFVYVWFFVPETRGCTLEKMDEVFKDNRAAHDIELKTRTLRAVYDEKRVAQGA